MHVWKYVCMCGMEWNGLKWNESEMEWIVRIVYVCMCVYVCVYVCNVCNVCDVCNVCMLYNVV